MSELLPMYGVVRIVLDIISFRLRFLLLFIVLLLLCVLSVLFDFYAAIVLNKNEYKTQFSFNMTY